MADMIQIKRSLTAASPGSLANGELAFSSNGNVLFVGANGAVEPIGGKRFPGTLTANQALVANSTSGIDTVKAGTVTVVGTTTSSNTTTGAATVAGGLGVAGRINTGDLAAGNTSVYSTLNGTALTTQDVLATGTVNAVTLSVGGWVIANNSGVFTSGVVNGDILSVGTYFKANTTQVTIGTGVGLSVNGSVGTAGYILKSNGTSSYWDAPAATVSGSNTQVQFNDSGTANGSSAFTFNKSTSTLTATNISGNGASITSVDAATVGGNTASTLRTYTDNQAGNAFSNAVSSATALAGNAYSNAVSAATALAGNAYSNAVSAATDLAGNAYSNAIAYAASNSYVNSTFATNTYVNSTFATNTYVNSTFATNTYVTSTFAALTGATFTGAATFVDLTVNGNTKLGDASSDVVSIIASVNTSIMPSANATYNLGNNTIRWQEVHAQNVHSEYLYIDKDVQISGNLTVTGNVTTINVATLAVTDSLIQLATNNTSSDLIDIGVYGNYQVSGGDHEHTGLFRDATDGNWKLFIGLTEAPTSTVNIAGTGYAKGTLDAYLLSGGLVSNSSAVALTANSTLAVSMVANTLTLSTPLAATSGGTGFNSYTAADILTAANGTHFSKLSLGTDGQVLQSNGTALVYATLDGGSF